MEKAQQLVTRLPRWHMLSIMLLRLGHPMQMKSPYPWLPQALKQSSSVVSDENLGYYVGLVEGLFTACICMALIMLVRLSDIVGRKPVTLVSIAGAGVFICLFGLARGLTSLIILRVLGGLFNGSQAILRVILAETVDDSNQAIGYALFSTCWQGGALAAPVIGGLLANPTRFALFADSQLFATYPFLLPCIVSAVIPGLGVLLAIFCMRETKPDNSIDHAKYVPLSQSEDANTPPPSPRPNGVRALVRSEGISQCLFCWLWLMLSQATFESVSIVYAATTLELGGLGLSTSEIGMALTVLALATTASTIFMFPRLVQRWGAVRVAQVTSWGTPLAYLTMPCWHYAARAHGPNEIRWLLWTLMLVTMVTRIPATMAVQAMEMYASRRAPQKSMTASLNGMISMIGNAMYAVGPMLSASAFSLCLKETGSGLLAFVLFAVMGMACVWSCARVQIPRSEIKAEEAEKPVP